MSREDRTTRQTDESEALIFVHVAPQFAGDVAEEDLRRAAATTIHLSMVIQDTEAEAPAEMSIVIVDDDTMQQLNRDYRGVDSTTDVLSFGDEADEFVSAAEGEGSYLGDVVISCPRARVQAAAAGHPLGAELSLLVVHGVLHLLGYDHADAEKKAAMWRQQAEILNQLGLQGVLPTEDD